MKKIFLILLFLCACSQNTENIINGYIEGEYIYVSPSSGGILDELDVIKGQNINIGDKLFAVDNEIWLISLRNAENNIKAAKEQLNQTTAILNNAEKEFNRAAKLVKTNATSLADYDTKQANYENLKAKVSELKILVLSAEEKFLQLKKKYQQNTVISKQAGQITDIYFRLGEYVAAGNPILAILPPENIKARFFISEKFLPKITYNQKVWIRCDGCEKELEAKISYISPSAEYTPPVIYSTESRNKLVFMVEAIFINKTENLHPGLPINVRLK